MFRTEHLEISAGLGRFPSVEEIVFREGSSFLNGSARDSLAAFTFLVRVAHKKDAILGARERDGRIPA